MAAPPSETPLANRVAVVTGAARNIGAATAEAVVAAGGRVLATDVDRAGLAATVGRIRARHGEALVSSHSGDLVHPETAEAVVDAALAAHGRLDVVVHAAVDPARGLIGELTPDDWQRAFSVNVGAAGWLVRAALPHLRPGSSVVLFSSVQAHGGFHNCTLYGATKGAVESFTRHLAFELGPRGIRVNAISPGFVLPTQPTGGQRVEIAAYPLRRFGHPDEVARTVVFLASDASAWTTGAIMAVDGGTSAVSPAQAVRTAEPATPRRWPAALRRIGGRIRR